jgi:hypothetical protein
LLDDRLDVGAPAEVAGDPEGVLGSADVVLGSLAKVAVDNVGQDETLFPGAKRTETKRNLELEAGDAKVRSTCWADSEVSFEGWITCAVSVATAAPCSMPAIEHESRRPVRGDGVS